MIEGLIEEPNVETDELNFLDSLAEARTQKDVHDWLVSCTQIDDMELTSKSIIREIEKNHILETAYQEVSTSPSPIEILAMDAAINNNLKRLIPENIEEFRKEEKERIQTP